MANAVKYLANVGRSVQYATVKVVKDMNPVVTDLIETNQDIAKVTYSSIKNFKTLSAKAAKTLSQSQYGELARDYKKNLLEDIKNGTFYNKRREDKVNTEIGMSDAWNVDESEFFVDEDSSDDNFDESEFLVDSIDDTAERSVSAVSQVLARTSEYQVEATRQSTSRILAQTSAMSAQLHSDLGVLNANVSGLMKFNTEAMATHIENSRAFYERQQQQMDEQTTILKELLEFQKSIYTPKTKSMTSKVNVNDIFTSTGAINLAEYFKLIKQNAADADTMGMGGLLKEYVEAGGLKSLAANPLGGLVEGVVRGFVPGLLKNTFKEFNDSLSGAFATALLKVSKSRNSYENPIVSAIGNILGVNLDNNRKLDSSNYNKEATSWTGKDHKALTEVIPTLLNKIYSSISGTGETRYDYETGKFISVKDIKKKFEFTKNRYVGEANREVIPYLESMMSQINFGSKERRDEFAKTLEKVLKENFKNMEFFNPNDSNITAKRYGLKGEHADYDLKLIKRMWSQIPKSKQLLNNRALLDAYEQYGDWIDRLNSDGDNVVLSLANGSISKKKKKSKNAPLFGDIGLKIDTTNSILENIRILLGGEPGSEKVQPTTQPTVKTEAKVKVKNKQKKPSQNKNNKVMDPYYSDMGFFISEDENANFTIDDKKNRMTRIKYNPDKVSENTYLNRLKKAKTPTQKMFAFLSGSKDLAQQPLNFFANVLRKADERMYTLLFGSNDKDKKSILGKISDGIDSWVENLKDITKEKFDDFKEWLTGKSIGNKLHDFFSNVLDIDTKTWLKDFRKAAFGDPNMGFGEGMRKVFGEGFSDIFKGVKNIFNDTDTIKTVRGTRTKKSQQEKEEADQLSRVGKAVNKKFNQAVKNNPNDDGTGKTEPIKKSATGTRRVSKTGIIAVSEGEMIIPPDMNPYNIAEREKNEDEAIAKFEDAYGPSDIWGKFAKGGRASKNRQRANRTSKGNNTKNKKPQKTEEEKIADKIKNIFKQNDLDKEVDISKKLSEMSDEKITKVLDYLDDETIAALKDRWVDIKRHATKNFIKGREKFESGAESIVYKMGDAAKDIYSDAKENVVINDMLGKISKVMTDNTKATSEGKEVVKDVMNNFGSYLPRVAAGGVTGLALSALLGLAGGPLLGVAVGSGLGLLSNSKKLQTWLFGEEVTDDEGNKSIKGGVLSDNIKKNVRKYFPNMSKGAIVGGITSILPFVPGGPMAGILVGSAVGFAKSNDKLREKLFGEDKLLTKMNKTLQAKLPKMGLGAATMFLGGPFGVTTNLMLGAGLGFVSDTEKFKDIVFGTKGSNGERTGGLVQYITELTEVPIEQAKKLWHETVDWFHNTFLPPLKKAVSPIARQFKNMGNWVKDAITGGIRDHITRPLGRMVMDKFIKPVQKGAAWIIRKIVAPIARFPLSLGAKAVGAIGGGLRRHQLRVGNADGTAAEQLAEMDNLDAKRIFGRKFKGSKGYKQSKMLASMSDSQVLELQGMDAYLNEMGTAVTDKGRKKAMSKFSKHMIGGNDKNLFRDIKQLADKKIMDGTDANKLEDAIIAGDLKTAKALFDIVKPDDSKNFTDDDRKALWGRIRKAIKVAIDARKTASKAKDIRKQIYKQYGIKIGTGKTKRILDQEVDGRGLNKKEEESPEKKTAETVADMSKNQQKNHQDVIQSLNSIQDLLEAIAFPKSTKAKSMRKAYREKEEEKKKEEAAKKDAEKVSADVVDKNGEKVVETVASLEDAKVLAEQGMTSEANDLASGKPIKASKFKNFARRLTNKVTRSLKAAKTVITEYGPIRTRLDNMGNEIPDNRDSETKDTLKAVASKEETQKGILSKLSNLGSSLKGIFGGDDEDDEEKEGIFSKIIKGALKYALPVLGGLAGLGLASKVANKKVKVQQRDAAGNKLYDENGNPIMTEVTIADAVKDGAARMWLGDDLTGNTNGAWFHIKDFTRNTVIPLIGSGIDLVTKNIPELIGKGVELIVSRAPEVLVQIGIGIAKGLASAIGGVFKGFAGKSDEEKEDEAKELTKKYTNYQFTPAIGNAAGSTTSANNSTSSSNSSASTEYSDGATGQLQKLFDNAVGGSVTSSKSITSSAASSSTVKSVNTSTNSAYASAATNTSSLVSTPKSKYSAKDVKKQIKESVAYKNSNKTMQKKLLEILAPIWDSPVVFGMYTPSQICNDPTVVLGSFVDGYGNTITVTAENVFTYPEIASQIFGVDLTYTEKEEKEATKDIRNATSNNPIAEYMAKSVLSGGQYGVIGKTGKILPKVTGRILKGATKTANVLNKAGGLGRAAGTVLKGSAQATHVISRAVSYPFRAMDSIAHGAGTFMNATAATKSVTGGLKAVGSSIASNVKTKAVGALDKFQEGVISLYDKNPGKFNFTKNAKGKVADKVLDFTDNLKGNITNAGVDDVKKGLSGIKNAYSKYAKKGADAIKKSSVGGKLSGAASKILGKMKDLVTKILNSSKVSEGLTKVFKAANKAKSKVSSSKVKKCLQELGEKIIKKITTKLAKSTPKLLVKVSSFLANKAPLIGLIFNALDFVSGWGKADAIMGVEEPTLAERFISGLVNMLNNYCGLSLIFEPGEIIDMLVNILDIFFDFSDLRKRQEEVKQLVAEYNATHPEKITVEEYLLSDHLSTKVKKALGKAAGAVVNFGKGIVSGITGFFGFGKSEEEESGDAKAENVDETESSTVSQVTAAEDAATSNYVYDNDGNVVGYDKNTGDGFIDTMYVPQGDTSEDESGNIAGIDSNFSATGNSSSSLATDMSNTIDALTSDDDTTVDHTPSALAGTGSVVSPENTRLINSAYNDINNYIPNLVKQVKANLARYFGVNPSDMDRTTDIGMNTMKGSGPAQLFNRLRTMWSQVNSRISPFTRSLPQTLYSGMKDLSRFLAVNMGFASPEDDDVDLQELVQDSSYVDQRAEQVARTSPFAFVNGLNGSATNDSKNAVASAQDMQSADSEKANTNTFTSKITNGVKGLLRGISNFFGIGGSGSGMDSDGNVQDSRGLADKSTFISQKYGEYANRQFTISGDRKREKIKDSGCAPAVATMAINAAGFSAKPITMDEAMKSALQYKKPNGGVTADYFIDEFDKHGLNAAYVTAKSSKMKDTIMKRLSGGTPIILMGKDEKNTSKTNSPFGPKTHYVVATDISKDKQTIYVNDPEASKPRIGYKASKLLNGVMLGIAPIVRTSNKNKANAMVTKIKRLLASFSASGKYGEDTIEYKVWTRMRAAGYSEITVAGTMGNIYAESGFDPSVVEHGNGIGFGLIQWSFGRRTAIEQYARDNGRDVNTAELQIEYLLKECDPNDSVFAWMNSSKSYDGKSWTYDDWKNAKDIDAAVRSFMFCFERPAGTSSLQKRLDAAKEYYEEFTGTAIPDSFDDEEPTNGGETVEGLSPIEQIIQSFTKLAKAYGLTDGDSSGTTEDDSNGGSPDLSDMEIDSDIHGNVSKNKEYAKQQIALVNKMKSVEGTLVYGQGNSSYPASRDPDQGGGDCSSTVAWAYKNMINVDPGLNTTYQETDDDTYTVSTSTADESKLQLGDLLLKRNPGHVEMYYGDGRMIGHGNPSKLGPTVHNLGSSPPYNIIRRWKGFQDGEESTHFDGVDGGSGTGLFVSQNSNAYANKLIGNRTVADAGCAPAVATMALSNTNKKYTMNKAIKDASKYQNSSGNVTADYFADTFTKNGINPSFIVGNNVDNLKSAISKGNVVLLGKDKSNKNKTRSPFGPTGHYVLATGLSKDGKYVLINDPESKTANKKYSIDILKHTSLGISTIGSTALKITDKIKEKLKALAGAANYKYLFSGDSRTVGIQWTVEKDHPETQFIAKAGIGYQWMKDTAWSQIKDSMDKNPDMKVVFLYGVNDMININYYLKKYKSLESEYDKDRIWYVSVNPIKGKQLVTDDQIQEFNKQIKELAGDRYIDTYTMLNNDGFGSPDGLHYDNDTNEKIYNYIIDAIANGGDTTKKKTTQTDEELSPLTELTNAFTKLARGYGLAGEETTVSSDSDDNGSNNSSTKGSSYPKYDLTDSQKKLAAGVIAGETGGEDLVAAKQEASQMANLNEVQYGKDATGSNLESTLKGGWYASASLSKSPTDTTLKAVEEVLVNGKRALPRYVTEHDMFPLDAAISGHWNNGKSEDRSQYKRDTTVIHQNPSRFSSPANYKFYDFFGENRDGDVAGYYDQYYDKYKDDVAWAGSGSGLTTPSFNYNKSTSATTTTPTSTRTQVTTVRTNTSTTNKLVEIVVKLLSQVVDNTASIKDIASLLVKLIDAKGTGNNSSLSEAAAKGAINASQLAMQALRESTRSTQNEEIMKLIQSVESIAMQ